MYGPYNSSSDPLDITGANANYDWGVYNAIVNPKTNTTDPPGTWRTPTIQEWRYFILPEGRNTGSGMRYVHCNVAGVNGIILFPDNWSPATYTFVHVNGTLNTGVDYSDNVISTADWTMLDNAGCAFLPAAGFRYSFVRAVSMKGFYWSSTANSEYWTAYNFGIHSYYVEAAYMGNVGHQPREGESVRLVKDY